MAERTFKSYTPAQAQAYSDARGDYNKALYNVICEQHANTGGQFEHLLDLGCGPGNATRRLASRFDEAIGIDASEAMIDKAREMGGQTKQGAPIRYENAAAEEVGRGLIEEGQVDLVSAGMAFHWFDLPKLYRSAAKMLRPGGSIAAWINGDMYFHPSMPHASDMQQAWERLLMENTLEYENAGNRICREWYEGLTMPWDLDPPVEALPKQDVKRMNWDRGGLREGAKEFFLGNQHLTLEELGDQLASYSQVTRWRQAHPETAGTEDDVVAKTVKEVGQLAAGKKVLVGRGCLLLLLKKR